MFIKKFFPYLFLFLFVGCSSGPKPKWDFEVTFNADGILLNAVIQSSDGTPIRATVLDAELEQYVEVEASIIDTSTLQFAPAPEYLRINGDMLIVIDPGGVIAYWAKEYDFNQTIIMGNQQTGGVVNDATYMATMVGASAEEIQELLQVLEDLLGYQPIQVETPEGETG